MENRNSEHTLSRGPSHFPIPLSRSTETQTLTMSFLASELIRVRGQMNCAITRLQGDTFHSIHRAESPTITIHTMSEHHSIKLEQTKPRGWKNDGTPQISTPSGRQVLSVCRLPANTATRWSPKAEPSSEAHRCLHSTHQALRTTLCNALACHIDA